MSEDKLEIISLDNNNIRNKIYFIREKQVMIDRCLAKLYDVATKRLNEQVKINIERFPKNFMFHVDKKEKD